MNKIHIDPIKTSGFVFLILSIGCSLFHFYPKTYLYSKFINNFYANISSEFLSIAITILLIDYLYEIKEKKNTKSRLIRELGSSDKGFTSRALKELREYGWLEDGNLKYADLSNANLSGLNLEGADFTGVILKDADLSAYPENTLLCVLTISFPTV